MVQVSTRHEDFLVDTLALRSHIQVLRSPFANPEILKVLHGADSDIVWLQRDFGLYIVNLFDTGQVSVPIFSVWFSSPMTLVLSGGPRPQFSEILSGVSAGHVLWRFTGQVIPAGRLAVATAQSYHAAVRPRGHALPALHQRLLNVRRGHP